MKTKLIPKIIVITAVASFLLTAATSTHAQDNEDFMLTFDICYDELETYGTWYEIEYYGFAWRPFGMKHSWIPYTIGQWEATDEGWLWVSDFAWGWLPFHYGRWYDHPEIGWCWIPGYDWAPAWVTWNRTDDNIGWYPTPPVPLGSSFTVEPDDWFCISYDYFLSPYFRSRRLRGSMFWYRPCIIVNDIYFWNNCYYKYYDSTYIWPGPPIHVIEKKVHRRIPRKRVVTTKNINRNGKMNKRKQLEIFRPRSRQYSEKTGDLSVKKKNTLRLRKEKGKTVIKKSKPDVTERKTYKKYTKEITPAKLVESTSNRRVKIKTSSVPKPAPKQIIRKKQDRPISKERHTLSSHPLPPRPSRQPKTNINPGRTTFAPRTTPPRTSSPPTQTRRLPGTSTPPVQQPPGKMHQPRNSGYPAVNKNIMEYK